MTAKRKTKIVAFIFVLLCLLGAGAFLLFSFFKVTSVVVDGNENVPKERIVALSGILLDESVFKVDLYDVETNIRSDPYIDVLSVKRKLPDGIEIAVRERTPVAAVRFSSYMIIIDEMGVVLEIAPLGATGLIEVYGIDLQGYKVAEPMVTGDDFQGTSLVALFLTLKEADMLDWVESIDVSNPLDMSFRIHDGLNIKVGMPDELTAKLAWAKETIPELENRSMLDGELDVTSGKNAWYRVPRPAEEALDDASDDTEGDSLAPEASDKEPDDTGGEPAD